ncbi:MAG: uracil-DNA glycosylase [Vicinamibacterales bacterium]
MVTCTACDRLRQYCCGVGTTKRASFKDQTYWARPVPGFGDPGARVVIIGLAPAAHGANRTGRMFTGDGTGGSGDFLMTALHANGLANQTFSQDTGDGLRLTNAWITAAVRCAPPDNTPTPAEIGTCRTHLRAELAALRDACVYVALGRIALDAVWPVLAPLPAPARKPAFAHGAVVALSDGKSLVSSYHPSRQNTHTGRLTASMLADVFRLAVDLSSQARTV